MKRLYDYRVLSADDRGAAVAMGNFDGVHLGHQSVLALARAAAVELGAPYGVITFEPHPRSHFAPDAAPFRLMTPDARARRLAKLGVEILYELPFPEIASLDPERFVAEILADGLGVRHVVVGADFRFGRGRAGDVGTLRELGRRHGFGISVAPLVSDQHGEHSSTGIRAALADGLPEVAARILGHWHRIEGRVQHGDKRGRELGFPTINLALDGLHLPKFGVYAALVDVLDGPHRGRWRGVASLGTRPTFDGEKPNLEVYLLDFSGDLYGAAVSVALVAFQRPELRFESVTALITRMQRDAAEARDRLAVLT